MDQVDNLRQEAIEHTAKMTGLPEATVKRIIKSQFDYVMYRCSRLEEVKIRFFGCWKIKERYKDTALEMLNNMQEENKEVTT